MRNPRRIAALAVALAAGGTAAARAQTAEQPNLIFTISGGYLTGGSLWNIDRQPASVAQNVGYLWDTVSLARVLRPGFAATLGATYFGTPHLGYNVEVGFFGIGSESRCAPVVPFKPDADSKDQQACNYVQGQNIRGDVVGFLAGLIWRFTTRGIQPYARAAAGGAIVGTSYVETWGPVIVGASTGQGTEQNVFFLAEKSRKDVTWMVSLGVGAMLPLAPGYQLRFEVRDVITSLAVATGPAVPDTLSSNPPYAPTGTKVVHLPTITVGLDVVLERKRGRRY
jgi:hypothetical protein